ncbi:ABC transporter ATP-binding protein [Candidatus Epulonipiscium viviparus]|uniref:ABC transporter ATP-binding protein n=1 Tax=Candidatus Epulonipiscium viviparus TaxID=420336 RepID=UPI00016C0459|nr:ABC transporter ATP-binding protein [Candidatus Epulopiscium viviparus]
MIIEITNATKFYGKHKAIDNLSFNVDKGRIHGLIGVNGSGKTTLIKALVGIHELTSGQIKVFGEPVFENPAVKARIGYVADRNRFFKNYTVNALIKFYSEIYPKFSIKKFAVYNDKMQLPLNSRINSLSKGMQMRLSIMLNLSRSPEVLVLDEPTSGLDVIAINDVLNFIITEVNTNQMTVLISSHHLSKLNALCDNITIINHGKLNTHTLLNEHQNQIKKLQVIFTTPIDLSSFAADTAILDIQTIGSVHYIVTNNLPHIEAKIKAIGANLLEELPMTLEEIFVYANKN